VIGVVEDVRMFGLDVQTRPAIYVDARQTPWGLLGGLKVLLRTRTDSASAIDPARQAITVLRPDVTFGETVSMSELVSHSIGGRGTNKLLVVVSAVFGALGLCLAGLGIYGILSHTVSLRLREIGIRMALGAGRRRVAWIVVGYGLRLLTAGLALGLVCAWAATRGMASLLSGVTPADTGTYVAAAITLSLAVLLACLPAAYRAIRLDPMSFLRA
jgi:putative ABC transport system permease protein